jgi:protein-disulfide isomerase
VLGTEPQVIASYVDSGQARIVFWPVINHGDPSVYSTLTAHCVGAQDPQKFWDVHALLFENQGDLWRATRDYFVDTAVLAGADQAQFEACYDDPAQLAAVTALDATRRERGVFSQPVFDVGGSIFAGSIPYDRFAAIIDEVLAQNAP